MYIEALSEAPNEADPNDQDSVDSSEQLDPETKRYFEQLKFMLLSSTPRRASTEPSTDLDPSGLLTD